MNIKFKKLRPDALLPVTATSGSACFDLYTIDKITIKPKDFIRVHTGLSVEIPSGYFMQILPRSGISHRGIIIPNSPGVIDSDYRGELMVGLYNLFSEEEVFGKGSRIAQARIVKVEQVEFELVSELSDTKRGSGGLGSTG